jgi:bifunctional non-homologous end joining protein LigD
MAGTETFIEIEGRPLRLTNLEKPLFPNGFTKGQVIDYYVRIAPRLLPTISGRNVTLVRFPDGSTGKSFFSKNIPPSAPDWVERVKVSDNIYLVCRELATLVFLANLAALELHVPMHRIADGETEPEAIMFDLDPGPGTTVKECSQVALLIHELLRPLGMHLKVKTSGSKGLQVMATPPDQMPYAGPEGTAMFSKRVAEALERDHPLLVVSKMTKEIRKDRVFIDWSQNNGGKTTISVYSLRAREVPTVSAPVSWDEIEACADGAPLRFTADEVLVRDIDW